MTDLTRVELLHDEGRVERWTRFGRAATEEILDRRRRALWFAPGAVFAFVRWAANDYGTAVSRIDIMRAVRAGEPLTTVPGVRPGGEVYLRLNGWARVERVLQAIDQVEALDIDPVDACPDHWRHIANRLTVGETPRAYSLERHRAWLLRQGTSA